LKRYISFRMRQYSRFIRLPDLGKPPTEDAGCGAALLFCRMPGWVCEDKHDNCSAVNSRNAVRNWTSGCGGVWRAGRAQVGPCRRRFAFRQRPL
jgi:hypothetical protein